MYTPALSQRGLESSSKKEKLDPFSITNLFKTHDSSYNKPKGPKSLYSNNDLNDCYYP